MTKEQLFKWVDTGRELEFNYKGIKLSDMLSSIPEDKVDVF